MLGLMPGPVPVPVTRPSRPAPQREPCDNVIAIAAAAVAMSPTDTIAARPRAGRSFSRLWQHLRAWRGWLVLVLVLDLMAVPLALLTPLPLKVAVDNAIGGQPLPEWATTGPMGALVNVAGPGAAALVLAVVLVVALALVSQLQRNSSWLLQSWVGERIVLAFRAELFQRVQRLSMTYHDRRGIADSLYRIQYDATSVQWLAVYGVAPLLTALGTLVGITWVMYAMDSSLALLALAVMPALVLLTVFFGRRVRERWHEQKERESTVAAVLQESLSALRVVKAFGQEEREAERFRDRARRELSANLAVVRVQIVFYTLTAMVLAVGSAVALWIGTRHVQDGQLTIGQLTMVMAYLVQLYAPLEHLTQKVSELQGSFAGLDRAFALLDETVDVDDRPSARPLERARGEFEMRNAAYAYPGGARVFAGVNVRVPAGTRVGIVGRTGAGKTTLMNLLVRFQDPTAGALLLDGVDLRDWRLADLRRQFAIVLQEPLLFSSSVAENIAYGRPEATQEEIEAAARAANAHEFISAMPQGYATPVGERGMMLSGGQRQRIAIARAFLKDAPVLILDEPTSAVDPKTEALIIEAMERLMAGRTTFIVAHRLATLAHCDVVYAVQDGLLLPADAKTAEPLLSNAGLALEDPQAAHTPSTAEASS
jgi:ATP-binding cassette, subfamily B, bacterial